MGEFLETMDAWLSRAEKGEVELCELHDVALRIQNAKLERCKVLGMKADLPLVCLGPIEGLEGANR
jgi:hypothetical protein